MSRYIDRQPDGTRVVTISSMKECRLLYNDICCCADSEFSSETPNSEDCETCPCWRDEDGVIRSAEGRIRDDEEEEDED